MGFCGRREGVWGGVNIYCFFKMFVVISLDLLIMIWFVNDYEMFFFGKIGILGVCLVYYFVGIE